MTRTAEKEQPVRGVKARGMRDGTSHHAKRLPKNPNKRPTRLNMERAIRRMRAEDREAIRKALRQ